MIWALLAFALGAGLVHWLLRGSEVPLRRLLTFAVAAPVGFAVTSLVTFFAMLVHPQALSITTPLMWICGCWIALRALLRHRTWLPFGPPPKRPMFWLALLLLLACAVHAWMSVYAWSEHHPEGGGDAVFFWNLKATFFCLPAHWKTMFDPALAHAHPDYPLLLPISVVLHWHSGGTTGVASGGGTGGIAGTTEPGLYLALAFLVSTAMLVLWAVAARSTKTLGCLTAAFFVSIPMLTFETSQLYADVPLCCYVTMAGCLLLARWEHRCVPLLFGIAISAAAWTKAEGLPFFAIAAVAAAALHRKHALPALWTAPWGLVAALIVRYGLAGHSDYTADAALDWGRMEVILDGIGDHAFGDARWNGLWWLFGVVVLGAALVQRTTFFRRPITVVAGIVLAQNAVYVAAYLASPHRISWHVASSMTRLFVHTAGLALVCAVLLCRPQAALPAPQRTDRTAP